MYLSKRLLNMQLKLFMILIVSGLVIEIKGMKKINQQIKIYKDIIHPNEST